MKFEDFHFLVRCLRYRFHTEKLALKTLALLNLEGATVIDIGANKGIYSFWMARAVGASGKVFAFEPQPEMVRYINDRKRCFGLSGIVTRETALSDHGGTARLTRQRVGDGSASLHLERERSGNDEISVPLAKLDDFGLSNVKFIKCDVEGHELSVFFGARRLIETCRPVVQFESVAKDAGKLFSFFEDLGYVGAMFLDKAYVPHSVGWKIAHPKFGFEGHRDFLFFPETAVGSTVPPALYQRMRASMSMAPVAPGRRREKCGILSSKDSGKTFRFSDISDKLSD